MSQTIWDAKYCKHHHTVIDECIERCTDCGCILSVFVGVVSLQGDTRYIIESVTASVPIRDDGFIYGGGCSARWPETV